jgi:inorganic pyrophosphatase
VGDIPEYTRKEIEHFFARYKDLEPGKFVNIDGWDGAEKADQLVQEAIARLAEQGH